MVARTAWVFSGGSFSEKAFRQVSPKAGDFLVCVDHGLKHCLDTGLQPDLLVGDFDSAGAELLKQAEVVDVPRIEFPVAKDSSDLELALRCLCEKPIDVVYVVGVSGGRTDHLLINWQLMMQKAWPFALEFIDDTVRARVIHGADEISLDAEPGTIVSLVSLKDAGGISTLGLHYALHDALLPAGSSLGLSNIVVSGSFSVTVETGIVLVMVTNEKQQA